MNFRDKWLLVIGGSSGIGLAVARNAIACGASVVITGRNSDKLQQAALEVGGNQSFVFDASSEAEFSEVVNFAKQIGGFDAAVICAGTHKSRPIQLTCESDIICSMQENVLPFTNVLKLAPKLLRKGGASIVGISSVAALRGSAGFLSYSVAKAALLSATKVGAVELARRKIRVNTILAGVVATDMSKNWLGMLTEEQQTKIEENHLLGIGTPDDVALPALFLSSVYARWITGSLVTVDGGLSVR